MADFNEQLPDWLEAGIEPPTSKKNEGWQVDDKPPAAWWNWLLNRTYKVLVEIRSVFSAHKADTTVHITAAERTAWNAKETPAGAQTKANAVQTNLTAHIGSGGAAHADVTTTTDGFMTAADKVKLDGVAAGANNYTHPTTHPPSIIAQDASNRFTTDAEKAAWNAKASTAAATPSAAGLMSAADKTKLDGVAAGANAYVHPNHTGDVTSTGDGVTAISPGVIVDADVNSAAAIAWSKISKTGASLADLPTRSAADLSSGTLPAARLPAISGDITIPAGGGAAAITAGAIVDADVNASAQINATKIGTAGITNTEFGYLDGVTGNIQTQLNNRPQQTTADITYYVRTDGNDANNGLANTAAGAFKTIGKAISMIPQVVNHTAAINVAAGTYAEEPSLNGFSGAGYVGIYGTGIVNVLAMEIGRCQRIQIFGITFTTTTKTSVSTYDGGFVEFRNCIFTATGGQSGLVSFNQNCITDTCTFSNKSTAIQIVGGKVFVINCTGTNNTTAILPSNGAIVITKGSVPSGNIISAGDFGGIVNPWGDNTPNSRTFIDVTGTTQIISASVSTKIQFPNIAVDLLGEFFGSKFTAQRDGQYLISACVLLNGFAADSTIDLSIFLNGAVSAKTVRYPMRVGAQSAFLSIPVKLNAGSTIEIYINASSAGTIGSADGARTFLSIQREA